jgi:hypothetical protein
VRCGSCSRAWTTLWSTWSAAAAAGMKLQYAEFDWTLNRK